MTISRAIRLALLAFAVLASFILYRHSQRPAILGVQTTRLWDFQSVDTMKYSRDLAQEKANDASFGQIINRQVADIAATGATHVGIATPYDEEFVPFLQRWVAAARANNMKVWFHGNFSGWEGWFGYPPMDRSGHIAATKQYILNHPELFEDGDVFTPCPECENGGPGDPRLTHDVAGFREFIISENNAVAEVFAAINKQVTPNIVPLNWDVAKLVMDKQTTEALGGVVTVDHYVRTPQELKHDLLELAQSSGGKIVLGEFGAPIPDINGNYTEQEQADWISQALWEIATTQEVIGVNYWVNVGGSTQIWDPDGKKRKAVDSLTNYYKSGSLQGFIQNELNHPVANAVVSNQFKSMSTGENGFFILPCAQSCTQPISIAAEGYDPLVVTVSNDEANHITVSKSEPGLIYRVLRRIMQK